MSEKPISDLRRRMIADMTVRTLLRANSPVTDGASIAGRNAIRLDVGERIPNCSHTDWRNYDSACGYGVQWRVGPARKTSEVAGDRPLVGNAD